MEMKRTVELFEQLRRFERLQVELPSVEVAERTVRQYVRERREQLGLVAREVFIPQQYEWGTEAQVDWYEAAADVGGERHTIQVFCMRSMASGAAFHRAYPRATQQAFLEAHERAFAYFGGVFRRLRHYNLNKCGEEDTVSTTSSPVFSSCSMNSMIMLSTS